MEEIKRCPFCGGEGELKTKWDMWARRYSSTVYCKKCRANSGIWFQKPKAIESWNRRVSE